MTLSLSDTVIVLVTYLHYREDAARAVIVARITMMLTLKRDLYRELSWLSGRWSSIHTGMSSAVDGK